MSGRGKVTYQHGRRRAVMCLSGDSTLHQVERHVESSARQYALAERAIERGWPASRCQLWMRTRAGPGPQRKGGSVQGAGIWCRAVRPLKVLDHQQQLLHPRNGLQPGEQPIEQRSLRRFHGKRAHFTVGNPAAPARSRSSQRAATGRPPARACLQAPQSATKSGAKGSSASPSGRQSPTSAITPCRSARLQARRSGLFPIPASALISTTGLTPVFA